MTDLERAAQVCDDLREQIIDQGGADKGILRRAAYLIRAIPSRDWVSVKERLPEEYEPVLLFLPDGNRGLPGCEVGMRGGDCWWTNGGPNSGSDMDYWETATHWMPLPSPPGEQTMVAGQDATGSAGKPVSGDTVTGISDSEPVRERPSPAPAATLSDYDAKLDVLAGRDTAAQVACLPENPDVARDPGLSAAPTEGKQTAPAFAVPTSALPEAPYKTADGLWKAGKFECLDPLTAWFEYASELRQHAERLQRELAALNEKLREQCKS